MDKFLKQNLLLLLALFLLPVQFAASSPLGGHLQSAEHYAMAVADTSTAPHYVQISLKGADGDVRETCMLGWNLNLAIRLEYRISSDLDGIRRATEIALASPGRQFSFENPAAKAVVPIIFSEDDLNAARKKLAILSDTEIRQGFSLRPWGALHESFRATRERDAAACALIERGMAVGVADLTNTLYIDK